VFEEMDFPGFALNDLCRFYTVVVEKFFAASPSPNFISSQINEWENKLGKFKILLLTGENERTGKKFHYIDSW
jgi:hypothetical protein